MQYQMKCKIVLEQQQMQPGTKMLKWEPVGTSFVNAGLMPEQTFYSSTTYKSLSENMTTALGRKSGRQVTLENDEAECFY